MGIIADESFCKIKGELLSKLMEISRDSVCKFSVEIVEFKMIFEILLEFEDFTELILVEIFLMTQNCIFEQLVLFVFLHTKSKQNFYAS